MLALDPRLARAGNGRFGRGAAVKDARYGAGGAPARFSTQRGGRCSRPALPASSRIGALFKPRQQPGMSLWTLWTAAPLGHPWPRHRARTVPALVTGPLAAHLDLPG